MRWWLKKQLLRLKLYAKENYENEAESLVIWYPVLLALGAAFYFVLPFEPNVWAIVAFFEIVLVLLYILHNQREIFKLLTYILVFVLGLSIAKVDAIYQSHNVEYKSAEIIYLRGKVKELDYNYNNRPRLTLTEVNDFDNNLKGDFRISLSALPEWLKKDQCVEVVAKLPESFTPNPLSNYNNERANFYKGISATGYNLGPIYEVECETKTPYIKQSINQIRASIASLIDNTTDNKAGAIIKAITIGDKTSISEAETTNYRTAGLAHFLAISGMHLGMIALLIFFLVRLAFFKYGEGRYDFRKLAAVLSLTLTFAYFLISGQSISCIRAFIMTSLVLLGIIFNRRAISLRMWGFAVMIVVVITPSAVISPGFLMSFAAVLGLISFYERYRENLSQWFVKRNIYQKCLAYFVGVLITDLVASLMTLPYSMYYFHQISVYTSLGNLLAAPIIAFWIMPALLVFLISLPLGCGSYAIIPLAKGVEIINWITEYISSLPMAKSGEGVGAMPDWGILFLTLGLLWLCIWQAKWRVWGWLGIFIGIIGLYLHPTPDFVFDEAGSTYAYKASNNKLVLSPYHQNRFLSKMWTGNTTPYTDENHLKCTENSCLYQNRIEFGENFIKLDGKNIALNYGGFISLKSGIHYYIPKSNRLWHKSFK